MNIIEAVMVFAFITALFETVILMKIKPSTRLRILGSPVAVGCIHAIAFGVNMAVHYGTVTGSMTAVTAALASFVTVPAVRWYSGCIKAGRYYPGIRTYSVLEVAGLTVTSIAPRKQ